MRLCRVEGSVDATMKDPSLSGKKIMVVQPLNTIGRADGSSFLALDQVGAGRGDLVLVMKEGGGARIVLQDKKSPVQTLIIAIVDDFVVTEFNE